MGKYILEIAKTLGYSRTSIAVNQCIKAERFKKGIDYDILVGEDAREVIQPICDTHNFINIIKDVFIVK